MTLFSFLDLFGTFIFAITGAFRAVKYELDILGVLVLSVFTGVGGGILRDLIVGVVPPAAFTNEVYLVVCLAGGLLVFFAAPRLARWWTIVKVFDAIGLSVFAALGALQGWNHHLGPLGVIMTGTLTAVGGGVIRDVLVNEIPAVLSTDFYATAAAAGSLLFYLLRLSGVGEELALIGAAGLALALRLLAMKFRFRLPTAKRLPSAPADLAQPLRWPWRKRR